MSKIIITGCLNSHSNYNINNWQKSAVNNIINYSKYINSDIFIVNDDTKFIKLCNKIKKMSQGLVCDWSTFTLCSVWAFMHVYKQYREIIWVDLDLITNNKYNVFEVLSNPFEIQCGLFTKNQLGSAHCIKKRNFVENFVGCKQNELFKTSSSIVKMDQEMVNLLIKFCSQFNFKNIIDYFVSNYNNRNFLCDESVYEGFINQTQNIPKHIDINLFLINFNELSENEKESILKNKTDKFIHFVSDNKKYIPQFLEIK